MRDSQHLMTAFVKIVERYPEIYDPNFDGYRTRFSEMAWAKVAAHVKNELNEDCTVDELKLKWKGIRSSFNRYKSKLLQTNDASSCRKYYLYDHLRYLDPFVRVKGPVERELDKSENTLSESCNYVNVENIESTNEEYNTIEEWNHLEIKPETLEPTKTSIRPYNDTLNDVHNAIHSDVSCREREEKRNKRKLSYEDKETDDDNEDLQFFKSILPDIRNFTIREKRKLKMGILQLIDNLENERKQDGELQ